MLALLIPLDQCCNMLQAFRFKNMYMSKHLSNIKVLICGHEFKDNSTF